MLITAILVLLVLFQIKHFLADFIFQTEYMAANKGTFLHPGGVQHSLIHALFTLGILLIFTIPVAAILFSIIDLLLHYFIDFFKMNINERKCLTPYQRHFWVLLGFDQLLHQLTYLMIVWALL